MKSGSIDEILSRSRTSRDRAYDASYDRQIRRAFGDSPYFLLYGQPPGMKVRTIVRDTTSVADTSLTTNSLQTDTVVGLPRRDEPKSRAFDVEPAIANSGSSDSSDTISDFPNLDVLTQGECSSWSSPHLEASTHRDEDDAGSPSSPLNFALATVTARRERPPRKQDLPRRGPLA